MIQDAGYTNAAEFYTELFMVREEKQRYEEACKKWQQKCVEVKAEATKDSLNLGDAMSFEKGRSRFFKEHIIV